jgi:hypothetical protein
MSLMAWEILGYPVTGHMWVTLCTIQWKWWLRDYESFIKLLCMLRAMRLATVYNKFNSIIQSDSEIRPLTYSPLMEPWEISGKPITGLVWVTLCHEYMLCMVMTIFGQSLLLCTLTPKVQCWLVHRNHVIWRTTIRKFWRNGNDSKQPYSPLMEPWEISGKPITGLVWVTLCHEYMLCMVMTIFGQSHCS